VLRRFATAGVPVFSGNEAANDHRRVIDSRERPDESKDILPGVARMSTFNMKSRTPYFSTNGVGSACRSVRRRHLARQ